MYCSLTYPSHQGSQSLYVALINEFQLSKACAEEFPFDEPVQEDNFGPDPTLFRNTSAAFSKGLVQYSGFEPGTIDIIANVADRLVPLVCRDTINRLSAKLCVWSEGGRRRPADGS